MRNNRAVSLLMSRRPVVDILLLLIIAAFYVPGCQSSEGHGKLSAPGDADQQTQIRTVSEKKKMNLPPDTTFEPGENGTPRRIKGKNLAADLASVVEFQQALNRRDHSRMVFLWLTYYRDILKLNDPQKELRIERITTDKLGSTHVKMQQMIDNIPVWNQTVLIHFNKENGIYLFQGDYLPVAMLSGVSTTKAIQTSEAESIAVEAASKGASGWRVVERSEVVFIVAGKIPRPAYALTLSKGLANRYLYMVDAVDGRILHVTSLIRN